MSTSLPPGHLSSLISTSVCPSPPSACTSSSNAPPMEASSLFFTAPYRGTLLVRVCACLAHVPCVCVFLFVCSCVSGVKPPRSTHYVSSRTFAVVSVLCMCVVVDHRRDGASHADSCSSCVHTGCHWAVQPVANVHCTHAHQRPQLHHQFVLLPTIPTTKNIVRHTPLSVCAVWHRCRRRRGAAVAVFPARHLCRELCLLFTLHCPWCVPIICCFLLLLWRVCAEGCVGAVRLG